MAYGLYRINNASLDVFPEFSPTQVVIQTEAPGLSAELVETLVSQRIESGISGVPGIQDLRSQSIPGLSVVTAIFSDRSDLYRNRQLVAERLSALQRELPQNITPNITPLTSSASTVLGVGLTSEKRSLMELRTLVDRTLRPHLLGVSGVADVNVFGGEVRQWQVQVQPEKLVRFGLSLEQVTAAARKATAVRGAGFIENANQRIIVTTEGQAYTREQLAQVVVIETATQNITLGDVATIVQRAAPSIGAAQIDGKPGVFLAIQGQLGANTRAVTIALEKSLRDLAPLLARDEIDEPAHVPSGELYRNCHRESATGFDDRPHLGDHRAVFLFVQLAHGVYFEYARFRYRSLARLSCWITSASASTSWCSAG